MGGIPAFWSELFDHRDSEKPPKSGFAWVECLASSDLANRKLASRAGADKLVKIIHDTRMPKWLQGMVAPTLMLWLYAIAAGVAGGVGSSKRADLASNVAVGLITATWVIADARKRRRELCYDYDFLFILHGQLFISSRRGARGHSLHCSATPVFASSE